MAEVARLTGADRVATVWIDEYGPGLIHPYLVLDLLTDRPRRGFALDVLGHAWELGVPGVHDDGTDPVGSRGPTTVAIALGSDGTRAWFLVADSVTARPPLDGEVRDRLMFLAGECSAIALHRDLDRDEEDGDPADESRFAGWPILKDIEGREADEAEGRRIAQRFVVGRLVGMLIDDDLVVSEERLAEQARRARIELERDPKLEAQEQHLWTKVLDAYEAVAHEAMAATLIELGELAEARDHFFGALELYRCAYAIAASLGASAVAAHAARLRGRLLRRRADWGAATEWYEVAHAIAAAARLHDTAAHALNGLATIKKDLGNLPAAREAYARALEVARSSDDRDTLAAVHGGLLTVEQAAGNLDTALEHGWIAVATAASAVSRTRLLASLAGALADYGDREAAEDAWSVVAGTSEESYYRIYAHDALAYLGALRGDGQAFDRHAALCDALGWQSGAASAKAEIFYYRGLSCHALGRAGEAERWLSQAIEFAEAHGFNQTLFLAERALEELSSETSGYTEKAPTAPPDVREGIRALREAMVASS